MPSDAISSARKTPEERETRSEESAVTPKVLAWTCKEDGERVEGEDGYLMHLTRCQKGHLVPA